MDHRNKARIKPIFSLSVLTLSILVSACGEGTLNEEEGLAEATTNVSESEIDALTEAKTLSESEADTSIDEELVSVDAQTGSTTDIDEAPAYFQAGTDSTDQTENSPELGAASGETDADTDASESTDTDSASGSESSEQPESEVQSDAIIVGSNPGDAQCIDLSPGTQDYGNIDKSDWTSWLPGTRYALGGDYLAIIEDNELSANVFRHKFEPSSIGSARVITAADIDSYRTYRLAQSVYLEPGWEWGGEAHQGGKLGFGFGGGTTPSGGDIDPNGFTARIMWRGNQDGTAEIGIYSYAADRGKQYGENVLIDGYYPSAGEWIHLITEIKTNSSIDVSDGAMKIWMNGELVLERENVGWQLGGDTPAVDTLYYSSFYGGSTSEWAPSTTTYSRIGNICWSPVVDGYSGIDPDAGRYQVVTTQNSSTLNDDQQTGDATLQYLTLAANETANDTDEVVAILETLAPSLEPEVDLISSSVVAMNSTISYLRENNTTQVSIEPISNLQSSSQLLSAASTSEDLDAELQLRLQDYSRQLDSIAIDVLDQMFARFNLLASTVDCQTNTPPSDCGASTERFEQAITYRRDIDNLDTDTTEQGVLHSLILQSASSLDEARKLLIEGL